MTYNIHPILVHFPIAFLFLYSIIKIIPFSKWFPNVAWKQIERFLLLFGVLSAFVASSTGELADELTRPDNNIVEMHELFASATTWFYGLLLIGEALAVLNPFVISKLNIPILNKFLTFIQNLLTNNFTAKLLALLGLIAISITGLLGGVMVYGTTADPLAPIVLKLLGIGV